MRSEEPGFDPYFDPCDHEMVFEFTEGNLPPEAAQEVRRHLEHCPGCREVHEHETNLSCCLRSLEFSGPGSCSVHKVVAMALPTRSPLARLSWAALACSLLLLALVYLEFNGTEPVMVVMSVLAACWSFVSGSAGVVRAVFAAAGSTIFLVLAAGAVADLLIALAFVSVRRGRRAREV